MRTTTKQTVLLPLAGLVPLLFSACSTFSPVPDIQDSAPQQHIDVSTIPDAEPRHEPYSRYGNPESYVVYGQRYHILDSSEGYVARGVASWYGTKFHGRRTSSGEAYNMYAMTAAHRTLPIPTYAEVTNLDNGKRVIVKINDRGPFVKNRLIDLSYVAARKLGIFGHGTGRVEVRTITFDKPSAATTVAATAMTDMQQDKSAPPPSAQIDHGNNLYLQVGLFRDRSNAEQLRNKLAGLTLPSIHVSPDTSSAQTLYRVHIGPIAAESEADQLLEELARQGHPGFRIRVD